MNCGNPRTLIETKEVTPLIETQLIDLLWWLRRREKISRSKRPASDVNLLAVVAGRRPEHKTKRGQEMGKEKETDGRTRMTTITHEEDVQNFRRRMEANTEYEVERARGAKALRKADEILVQTRRYEREAFETFAMIREVELTIKKAEPNYGKRHEEQLEDIKAGIERLRDVIVMLNETVLENTPRLCYDNRGNVLTARGVTG
jgi:hypothetical protein